MVDVIDDRVIEVPIEERFVVETLSVVMVNFNGDDIKDYNETLKALVGTESYLYSLKKLDLDMKNRPTPPAKPSIKYPLVLE